MADLRRIRCFCGASNSVVTRTGLERDHLAVCSPECWDKRIQAGIYTYPAQQRVLDGGQRPDLRGFDWEGYYRDQSARFNRLREASA